MWTSSSKTEQVVQGQQAFAFRVVNVNWTVVFQHFEDLKDLIILKILKKKNGYVLPPGLFLSWNCVKFFKPLCK